MRADCITVSPTEDLWTSVNESGAAPTFGISIADGSGNPEEQSLQLNPSQVRRLRERCEAFLKEHGDG